MPNLSYSIELDDLNIDLEDKQRDNMRAIENSLAKIQEILDDINKRLKALE